MDFEAYKQQFLEILDSPEHVKPYDNEDYINYARLNWSRMQRWLKTGILNPEFLTAIQSINKKQYWIIITEPWCGDAAHILPFIAMATQSNPLITVDYQLRDEPPFLIDQYLTHGSKSIPKLIIQDEDHHDLVVWGPRPAGCQVLYDELTNNHVDYSLKKIALQKWYNEDKGISLQSELRSILLKLAI